MADESFKDFALDQLSALSELRAKAMFGGYGLYQGKNFFGILFDGRLYFKTDEKSRKEYVAEGMEPFTFEQRGRVMTMQYHEVPAPRVGGS
jgi:DNA transformation protein